MQSTTPATERVYKDLIARICDDAPIGGFAQDTDFLPIASPLSDAELAAACLVHAQALADHLSLGELAVNYFNHTLGDASLIAHFRAATERVICDAIRDEVFAELEVRNELAWEQRNDSFYGSASPQTNRERAEVEHGVRSLFR